MRRRGSPAPQDRSEGVIETLRALVTFSFVPHDWSTLHGKVPVFGSLFTLLLPCLLLFRKTRRTWGLVLWIHVAIATWYSVHHQDRYLQTLMPLMAAVVAAVLIRIWRSGSWARGALLPLVGAQVAWGGDVYFIPTHQMLHDSPIPRVAQLLSGGYKKQYDERFVFGAKKYVAIGEGDLQSETCACSCICWRPLVSRAPPSWIGLPNSSASITDATFGQPGLAPRCLGDHVVVQREEPGPASLASDLVSWTWRSGM